MPASFEDPNAVDGMVVRATPPGELPSAGQISSKVSATAREQAPRTRGFLDRLAEGGNTSRAAVVHARTLEVLARLDVTRRLEARGIVVPTFTIRDRDRVLATVPFGWLPTRYPHTLMIPQQTTEDILLGRLRELGGDVHRPYAMRACSQERDRVHLRVEGPDEAIHTLSAEYVVGADGMHSGVREAAGIGFNGGSYAESFVLADVHMSWPLPDDEVALFFSPQGLVVVAPLPEKGGTGLSPPAKRHRSSRMPRSSRRCSTNAGPRRTAVGSATSSGVPGFVSTIGWPIVIEPGASSSRAMPPTCTARRAARE